MLLEIVELWAIFFVFWSLHVLLQIEVSVRSSSNGLGTGFAGMRQWVRLSWVLLAVRLAFSMVAFDIWVKTPAFFSGASLVSIPLEAQAALFAFSIDSFVDKLAVLAGMRVEIPKLVPPTQ